MDTNTAFGLDMKRTHAYLITGSLFVKWKKVVSCGILLRNQFDSKHNESKPTFKHRDIV